MAGIAIITNPHSKLNRKNPNRPRYLSYIAGEAGKVEITQSLKELDNVAKGFAERGPSVIAINGGDGTISRTLTALIRAYQEKPLPPIAILGGGTINMLAQNLGIRGRPESLLVELIEGYSVGENFQKKKLSTLKVKGEYGFLYADGTCALFLKEFYKNKTGKLGSAWLIVKTILSRFFSSNFYYKIVQSFYTRIDSDGQESIKSLTLSNLVATVPKMPMGPRMFDQVIPGEKMQWISFTMLAKQAFWGVPWTMISKIRSESPLKRIGTAGKCFIEGEATRFYTLDGELFENEDPGISIELGPTIEFLIL